MSLVCLECIVGLVRRMVFDDPKIKSNESTDFDDLKEFIDQLSSMIQKEIQWKVLTLII